MVQSWLSNPVHTVSDTEKQFLLNDIRLSLISPEDLFLKIIPTELFSSEKILDALRDQTLLNHVDLPHRGKIHVVKWNVQPIMHLFSDF